MEIKSTTNGIAQNIFLKICILILQTVFSLSLMSQSAFKYNVHAGLGIYTAKLDKRNTSYDYFYRTHPNINSELGIKTQIFLKSRFSIYLDVSMAQMTMSTQRIIGILPHPEFPDELEYRQEYWSDYRFLNAVVRPGIEYYFQNSFSVSFSGQYIYNLSTTEIRQEKWLAFPVSESVIFESKKLTANGVFRKSDYGIHGDFSYKINKKVSFSIGCFYTGHSLMNPFKGNWMEGRSLILTINFHFL